MSSSEDRKSPHEIVIVRRRSGGHGDGHHGGAWKIAFADFMTALMCFFLVMWLVNASDKKTITQIATYFNPLRLNDRFTTQKGLEDPDNRPPPPEPIKGKAQPNSQPRDSKGKSEPIDGAVSQKSGLASSADKALVAEMDLIRDPYGVIERIVASEPNLAPNATSAADKKAGMPKDLFDPQGGAAVKGDNGSAAGLPDQESAKAGKQRTAPSTDRDEGAKAPATLKTRQSSASPMRDELSTDRLEAEIAESIARLQVSLKPRVEISDLGKEVLISITDEIDHAMFGIGSSRPTPVLIQVMDTVGRALVGKGGAIVVRGHTDARPYSLAGYDNWRLSAARAQIAYHMLVRGGLPQERVQRIEGHAERRLRVPADPLAPQNRRIEILVAKEKS